MTEKIKVVPNPEAESPIEETETVRPKFPTKLVRNVLIGAAGVAITGYVVSKLKNKDDETDSEETAPWMNIAVPVQTPSE